MINVNNTRFRDPMGISDDSNFKNIVYDHKIVSEFDSDSESGKEDFSQSIATSNIIPKEWSYSKKQATGITFSLAPGIRIEINCKETINYYYLIANAFFLILLPIKLMHMQSTI